jgi:hypothetical protein
MRKLFWLISGISIGLVLAKRIEQNPSAKAIAEDVKRAAKEFGTAVAEGFNEREAELSPAKSAQAKRPAAKSVAKPTAK